MADNYLERKMEEYRSGAPRKSVHKVASLGSKPGMWGMPFAERRVLIVGAGLPPDVRLVEQLRSVGCKVAFMGGDGAAGTELARKTGAQYHPCCYSDADAMARSVAIICRNWGDIDVVVSTVGCFPLAIAKGWNDYRVDKPYPNSYGGRIIAVNGATLPGKEELEALKVHGIAAMTVEADDAEAVVDAVMMAMLHKVRINMWI